MFPVRLWSTVQQKVYQLPFCFDRRWLQKQQKKVKSSLKIRRSVCNETGRMLWHRPALKQQLKFSLYSSQARHQTTTYVRHQGGSEVLNEGRILLSLTDHSYIHFHLHVKCCAVLLQLNSSSLTSQDRGNHVSRMALIHNDCSTVG